MELNVTRSPIDWTAVLSEHGRWLRTVIRARLGDPQGVDEVMQEVSLAAVAQRAPLSDTSKLNAWLYQLAVRQSLLYRRSQGRRRRLVDRYQSEVIEAREDQSRTTDPLNWLMAAERRELVRRAVDSLPSRDRELLALKYTEGWSNRELADRLGKTESAIETRLHRVRRRLRTRLQSLGDVVESATEQTPTPNLKIV